MHLFRCDATVKPTCQHAFQTFQTNLNLNLKLTTVVHYGIHLENWTAQSTTQQNEPILYKSRSKSRYKHFEILQAYFNTCISHISKKILTFLIASRRTSNQLPNIATTVSPTNGKTRHNSRSTYAKRIEITRLNDVFTQLFT